jgi:hypothetical protein
VPAYSNWIPAESRAADGSGVFFTHLDWAALDETEDDPDDADYEDEGETEELVEDVPILGLPFYGAVLTLFAAFGIMFYPFMGDALPDDDEDVEGVETETTTWVGDAIVFGGAYDPEVFAEQYATDFEEVETRDSYTLYAGASGGFSEGMAYAVSEKPLVVGMAPSEDDEYETVDVVTDALDRHLDEVDRALDSDGGQWLFETTGDAELAFGVLGTDDFGAALDADDVDAGEEAQQPDADPDPDVDDNPVFETIESLLNTMEFTVEDGQATRMDVRFSGIYPDEESTPTEAEVREHLIGEVEIDHDIVIDGTRVHAAATFEETPTDE